MMIYPAIIRAKDDEILILGNSGINRMDRIAEWCREQWADAIDKDVPIPLTTIEIVQTYFSEENMGSHHYVTMFNPEEVK